MPTAQAANPEIANGVCDYSEYCAYQYGGKGGKDADFNACEPDWFCGVYDLSRWEYWQSATIIDNQTSSIWARGTEYDYALWTENKGGGGNRFCVPSGYYFTEADLNALGMNNRISSMWTSPTCS